jgi:hypothetical protein
MSLSGAEDPLRVSNVDLHSTPYNKRKRVPYIKFTFQECLLKYETFFFFRQTFWQQKNAKG